MAYMLTQTDQNNSADNSARYSCFAVYQSGTKRGTGMAITYYVGIDAPAIEIHNLKELYEALDVLHTQVMDNVDEDSPALRILSDAMDAVRALMADE